ncbi:MAG: hypothetical protein IPF62_08035 [Bacteroidetes bacterium]|nr:hypothetical protein [Bacteroidota bacterium]
MRNLLFSLLMLSSFSASSQNNYRIQSKLGLDMVQEDEFGDALSVRVTNLTIDSAVHTKWKSGVKTDTRSRDEMKCLGLEGYITKYDFSKETGFYIIELSSKTGATIKCYFPTYSIDKIIEEGPNMAIEDARVLFNMVHNYNSSLKTFKKCKDDLLEFARLNNLNIGTKYEIAEKNKVQIYGFLLLDASDKAELQPVIKIRWNIPTIEEIEEKEKEENKKEKQRMLRELKRNK